MGGIGTAKQRIPTVEVVVIGDLDMVTAPEVAATLQQASALHPGQLIIDLAQCGTIDAAGILLLLDTHRHAVRDGVTVVLRSPSARVQRNLRLARVDRVLRVLNSCPQADASPPGQCEDEGHAP